MRPEVPLEELKAMLEKGDENLAVIGSFRAWRSLGRLFVENKRSWGGSIRVYNWKTLRFVAFL